MSANARRGEIEAELDGKPQRLCLTLGALAELESAFAVDDLTALVERLSNGRFAARDLARIIGAGLRGAGSGITDDEVMGMSAGDGIAGMAAIVSELLEATFGRPSRSVSPPANPPAP